MVLSFGESYMTRPLDWISKHCVSGGESAKASRYPLLNLNASEKSPCTVATAALLKDHLVETFTSGLQRSVASLKSIDLEYIGNNIGVGAGRQ